MSGGDLLDAATALFANDIIDENEFVAIYDQTRRKSPDFQYWEYDRVETQLQFMSNDECKADFRVDLADLSVLAEALRIPEKFVCPNRTTATGMEGLCVLLRRFAYPCRFNDIIPRFGRSVSELSLIASEVTDYIFATHGHLLTDMNQPWLRPDRLQFYADVIHDAGAALENCWGFVDGTVRPICRPGEHQREMFNGHKRVHAIKYQSVVAPNGLVAHLYGPIEGRRHDAMMLRLSGLLDQLQEHSNTPTGDPLCIYGDPAYPLRRHLQKPYQNANLSPMEAEFNRSMSSVRVAVEWVFGDILNYFKFIDFKKNLKIRLSAVGKMYTVCALLRNALTCLYGSTTSSYFQVNPPTIQEYFQLN